MADEVNTPVEEEEEDIFKMLGLDSDDEDEYSDLEADADEALAKEDKMMKKLSAKVDGMQKKFEETMIRERISHFDKEADDIERGLFKAVISDVKDVETLDKAIGLVKERAAKMKEEAEKYREQLEQQAQQQVAKAWGTSPVGTPTPRTKDYESELMKRVAAGDERAAFEAVIGDDIPFIR